MSMTLEQFRATHDTRAPLAGEKFIGHWYSADGRCYISEIDGEFRVVLAAGPATPFPTLAQAEEFAHGRLAAAGAI